MSNPAALKAAVDTGGANLVRGAATSSATWPAAARPAMVDPEQFTVGEDIAATPGAVVLRTEVFELIQYAPQTRQVHEVPLLIVPPTINKFYVLDLAPGRSMIEYLVRTASRCSRSRGATPTPATRDWGLDTYAAGGLEALDAVARDHAAASGVHLSAPAPAASSPHGRGPPRRHRRAGRLAGLTLAVTVLDQERAGHASAWSTASRRRGRAESAAGATSTAGRSPRCSPGCGPTT